MLSTIPKCHSRVSPMFSCQTQATISPFLKEGVLSTSDLSDMILDVEGLSLLSKTPFKHENTFQRSPIVTFLHF